MATDDRDDSNIQDLYAFADEPQAGVSFDMQREEQRCQPLKQHLTGEYRTPQEFYDWHVTLWNPVADPAKFPPEIFTEDCLLTDPFATVVGRKRCSLYFQVLFAVFPKLSGPHYSFATNENQIFINWAFRTSGGRVETEVPANDIFCFRDGLIYYRLATFDVASLVRALLSAYGGQRPRLDLNLLEEIYRWHVDENYARRVLQWVRGQRGVRG